MDSARLVRLVAPTVCLALGAACGSDEGFEALEVDLDAHAAEQTLSRSDLASRYTIDGEWLVSPLNEAPGGVSRVGAMIVLTEPGELPTIEAQVMEAGEPVGEWRPLVSTWSEEDHHVAVVDLDDIHTGVRIRLPSGDVDRLAMLKWNAVVPVGADEVSFDDDPGTIRQGLRGELASLGVVSRESWGARATRCNSRDSNRYRMAVHYTVTAATNPARQVRGIQAFHMDSRGWCDVGYHFLVGVDGSVYEGRPVHLRGAHVGNHNRGNIGVAFIGCFNSSGCSNFPPLQPPEVMIRAGGKILGGLAELYGITIDRQHLKGHRDHSGASTSCPGSNLHSRLDDLRALAAGAAIDPPDPTPEPTPEPVEPADCRGLSCDGCESARGCNWCASRQSCQDDGAACGWDGELSAGACWSELWPCWSATCWNPRVEVAECGQVVENEDFSSGRFAVHRYWTEVKTGGSTTLRLERTGGTYKPALLLTDRAGRLIYGGDTETMHPDVRIIGSNSGRNGIAQVTLEVLRNTGVLVYVSDWNVVDGGFSGSVSRSADYRLTVQQSCGAVPEPTPTPEPSPEPSPQPSECAGLDCGECGGTSSCSWCASRGICAGASAACAWSGKVGDEACIDEGLWPCWLADCWEPSANLQACSSWGIDEDFSSGRFSVHRFDIDIPAGGDTILRLERTAGSFAPAMLVTDRAGNLISGGDLASLHGDAQIVAAVAGRVGNVASVTLRAARAVSGYVYVTDWGVLDGAFSGRVSTTARYSFTAENRCQ